MAERKKRFSGLYWQQFALTAGMVMLTLLLLGVSFFALSYNYNFTERRDELQERASLIAQVSVDYLKSGGQTEDENLKRFISLGSAMTNAEFLVCNDSGYALLTADQRLGGKVVAIPQEITQEVLTAAACIRAAAVWAAPTPPNSSWWASPFRTATRPSAWCWR